MKGSLLIEVHGWRGVEAGSDLFSHALRLGFVTFYLSRELVTDALAELKVKLETLRSTIAGGR